jgi:hypothetical protein
MNTNPEIDRDGKLKYFNLGLKTGQKNNLSPTTELNCSKKSKIHQNWKIWRFLIVICLTNANFFLLTNGKATATITSAYCQLSQEEVNKKQQLRQQALQGNSQAKTQYQAIVKSHGEILQQCRAKNWIKEQAIWLRTYPCDVREGSFDLVFDRIVDRGYNVVYLEVFFDGQVLIPQAENRTPWQSVVRFKGYENVDLMSEAIEKAKARGIKIYAWLFSMNYGYSYAQLSNRQSALARNGKGQNSLEFVLDGSQTFIDPYSPQAQSDYYNLLKSVLKRPFDGVLFDYIRYPKGSGTDSVVGSVKDLWIYSESSKAALLNRAQNQQGRYLIEKYVTNGKISFKDITEIERLYSDESTPLWQGRSPSANEPKDSAQTKLQRWSGELWTLAVGHAAQGVLDFLNFISDPVLQRRLAAGAVFFPEGNGIVGNRGFDSRLQAWDRFPSSLEWHPMSYAICSDGSCIADQVKKVLNSAPSGTKVVPVLAGVWGGEYEKHPSLEIQMEALRKKLPQINAVSHFAFSWIEREVDRGRRSCKIE